MLIFAIPAGTALAQAKEVKPSRGQIPAIGTLLISFFHILYCSLRRRNRVSRGEIRKLLGFYVIPVIGTLVSMPYTGMPGTWTCAAVSVILIYMNELDREVLRDSLTGLNNRKALDSVFADFSKLSSPGSKLYLFMMDLDGFNGINDRNGHPAGDQALITDAGRPDQQSRYEPVPGQKRQAGHQRPVTAGREVDISVHFC